MANDFLTTYAPLANDIATRTGIDPSVVLGIIDTETGGGQHVSGNNIFGISPGGRVAGYPDVQTAANAFITLMQTPRYRGVAAASDPASQVTALVKSGYNTVNPAYATIVANKALSIGKQLGYQDKSGGTTEEGPAVYSTSSQPATTADSDSFVPAAASPPAAPQQPATAGSAKDRVLSDPALGGGSSAAPAQSPAASTAKDRVLRDPALAAPATTTTTSGTVAVPDVNAGPISSPGSVDEYGNVQAPLAAAPKPPSSLEDLRSQIQAGEANALRRLSSGPETGPVEDFARHAAGTGVALLSQAAQLPVNILMGITGGASTQNLTINPETGTLNLTPEALAAAQALAGPGAGGRDLRFVPHGGNPLEFVPPARSGGPLPPDVAGNLLSPDARVRATEAENQPPGFRTNVDPTKPFTYNPPSSGWPAGTEHWAENQPPSSPTGIKPPPPAPVPTTAAPVTEHTPWVSATTADIQRVLQENAEAGGPTSLGAMATPEQLAKMTPAQVKANRRVAELNQIVTPIEGEDTTEWVRGSTPTKAERMGTPTESQKERITQERNPDAFEGPNGVRTINDRARVNAYDETLLSDTQAADLKERQQKAAAEAQTRILSTAKPVDLKPAADWIEAKLADPLIQEDKHVYNSLKGLRDQLYDADGNLKTDPRAAWGMHNNLRNKLLDAKDPFSANPSEKYAVTQVNEFKGMVDGALDKASDGQFRTHLDQQAEFLKSLNAWRLLNDFRYGPNKMINAKSGMINSNAFHRFVTDLGIRRGRPGIDAAMDVPDNVMQRLINIDQDLKRAGRIDLGKPRGSQTNLFFELAGALGISGAHALAAAATVGTPYAGIANIGVQAGIGAVQRRLGQRRINRLTEQALQPPPGGLTPPPGNPLQP